MKLTILGSGTAIMCAERKGPSFLLETCGQLMMFDCGWGSGGQVLKAGYGLEQIDHIFITHPHPDHMGNLLGILQSILVSGMYFPQTKRSKTLYLHGYQGFKQDYETLRQISFPERIEPFRIEVFEYLETTKKMGDLTITSREVPHNPRLFKSIAYRIECEGESFFYSGDSSYSEALAELAKGADIAVFEIGVPPRQYREFGPHPSHLSPFEVGQLAAKAQTRHLVLSHVYAATNEVEALADVGRLFSGKTTVAQDLMVIDA
jgi:ribonuclease BN (tRNA processing enzyme)